MTKDKYLMFKKVDDICEFMDLIEDLEKMGFKRIDGKDHKDYKPWIKYKSRTGVIVNHRKEIRIVLATEGVQNLFDEKYIEYD